MPDQDVGVVLMFLWGGFIFVGFVIVLSILQALLEYVVKINDKKDDDYDFRPDIEDYLPDKEEQ